MDTLEIIDFKTLHFLLFFFSLPLFYCSLKDFLADLIFSLTKAQLSFLDRSMSVTQVNFKGVQVNWNI